MNVLVLTSAPGSSCDYYRGIGVLSKIKGVNLRLEPEVGWTILSQVDFVFAERPHLKSDVYILDLAKKFGVPIWVEVDDDFFSVPGYNPASATYGRADVQERHAQCLAMADVVSVTCEHLRSRLLDFNPNIEIVPNAFNDFHWDWKFNPATKDKLIWRGSATHRDDLRRYLSAMKQIAKYRPDLSWKFLGSDLWWLMEHFEDAASHPESHIIDYWTSTPKHQGKFWHVPLVDNEFNRSKSNIAWMEATFCGGVCIGPEWEQWQKPGILNYKSESGEGMGVESLPLVQDYYDKLLDLVSLSDADRVQKYTESFEWIKDNLMLSKVNEKRIEIMEKLCAS